MRIMYYDKSELHCSKIWFYKDKLICDDIWEVPIEKVNGIVEDDFEAESEDE